MSTPRSYVRFAALGDSVTYGLGDRASERSRGWARLLCEAIARDHHVSFCNLAHPGATAGDARSMQLSEALDHSPHLASLIIGLNDTMRSTWDSAAVRADLLHAASRLAEQGTLLLTVRFHDHSRVFGLPGRLARPLRQRIDELNATYDEIHRLHGGLQVDLASHPGVYDREFWSIDRLHPSELGHRALAHEFSALLSQHGLAFDPPALDLDGDPTTRLGELRTLAVEAAPWVARRVRDLAPSLGRKALQAALRRPHSSRGKVMKGDLVQVVRGGHP
ncbi:SGNH/GDSL hydrolase family protein [Nocardioides sp. GCM10030258]|jgi:lysophospholipase L1-like esterase|uniref:SGNH/GDSL hydrolase family protein n=1 Tax=unclassified Nocardioides TaxID=2615069 RepID=UPI003614B58C